MTGRRAFRAFTKKRAPLAPQEIEQETLLGLLLGDRRGARAILEYSGGDLRKLDGLDLRDLAGIPGVGEASAARVAALFALINRLLQPANAPGQSGLESA